MGDAAKFKICIDRDECIGDGLCADEAPETFVIDDEEKAILKEGDGDAREAIIAAAESCPVDCISVEDVATGEKLYPED